MADAPRAKVITKPVYVSSVQFDSARIGAAAVYCSDGRYGEQMDEFLHRGLGLPRYDRVAVPGGAACLAGHHMTMQERVALDRQLVFLIKSHELTRVVLIAHEGCGFYKDIYRAYRTMEEQQAIDLRKAAEQIRMWNTKVTIDAFFARKIEGRVAFDRWDLA